MSKRRRFKEDKTTPIAVTEADVVKPAESTNGAKRVVKKAQQCPACYNGYGGIGKRRWQTQVNGPLVRRSYSCDRCSATWTVEVRTDTVDGVEFKETNITSVELNDESKPR